ncbi:ROK family transcriptional regulator [Amycolatopsis sp. CA-230715]|uniref:ROK family transcriptional regulator n=1 Tax=Amycolatopsis sp. CA-230715 TaxID=2745196 RepID=UPI001C030BB3|nr:ROK family protein [Amycolatopsis sp. CA-230715]QWF78061.1 N-acetylmannosamine kinase [Amycolatopsis sp. CA-230715]
MPKEGSRLTEQPEVAPRTAAARILTLLHDSGPLSRTSATATLGLARSAVGTALAELDALGLVRTTAHTIAGSGRGRPSPLITPAPTGPFVVACALRPESLRVTTGTIGAPIAPPRHRALGARDVAPERLAAVVAEQVEHAVRQQAGTGRACAGVAVAIPGALRQDDGFVHSSLCYDWADVPFGTLLAAHLPGLPLHFDRDSNLTAKAEYRRGAAAGAANALVLTCDGKGIGGAVLNAGALFTGGGHAVEAGHLMVDSRGEPCPCGSRGCLERYADGVALARAAATSTAEKALCAKSPRAQRARRHAAGILGSGLAGLATVLDPDRIVLTEFLADLLAAEPDVLTREFHRASLLARTRGLRPVPGELAEPLLTGAVDHAFTPLLRDPHQIVG